MPGAPDNIGAGPNGASAWLWRVAGCILVTIGFVGLFVPLMPTTIFLILAASCFARSSPRLERWLLDHPRFGPSLRAWRRERAIPRRAKLMACTGMLIGFGLFCVFAHPGPVLMLVVGGLMAACAGWIVSRPAPGRPAPTGQTSAEKAP